MKIIEIILLCLTIMFGIIENLQGNFNEGLLWLILAIVFINSKKIDSMRGE